MCHDYSHPIHGVVRKLKIDTLHREMCHVREAQSYSIHSIVHREEPDTSDEDAEIFTYELSLYLLIDEAGERVASTYLDYRGSEQGTVESVHVYTVIDGTKPLPKVEAMLETAVAWGMPEEKRLNAKAEFIKLLAIADLFKTDTAAH